MSEEVSLLDRTLMNSQVEPQMQQSKTQTRRDFIQSLHLKRVS